jgi:dTDP-4-dehydrorhamnose 3,5-epimerase
VRFVETPIAGAIVVEVEPMEDERGFFARTWDAAEFEDHGLTAALAQCSISFNRHKGTLRGLHYQVAPHEEAKLVRCTAGAIFDVLVDLREASATYTRSFAVELTPGSGRQLYVPEGCAHGFLTLADSTEVSYQISEAYSPDHSRGVAWDDPAFGIPWPAAVSVISDRDRSHRPFAPTPPVSR